MIFPWLSASILLPIGASLLIPFVPDHGDGRQVRWYALGVTLTTFLLTVGAYLNGYDPSESGLQLVERVQWLPSLGLAWSVGADGLSMPLILLTSFITALACLAAWPVSFKPKLFYFLLLAMDGRQIYGLLIAVAGAAIDFLRRGRMGNGRHVLVTHRALEGPVHALLEFAAIHRQAALFAIGTRHRKARVAVTAQADRLVERRSIGRLVIGGSSPPDRKVDCQNECGEHGQCRSDAHVYLPPLLR